MNMAHNIYFNKEKEQHSFFSVQEKAWHGLGQIVEGFVTSKEAIQFAGLDYQVEKRELFTYDSEIIMDEQRWGTKIPEVAVPNYYATVRMDNDTVLGVVGKDYQVVQNADAFTFFDAIIGGDGIQYETAGALGKGERIFITAKLPSYIKVGRDDLINQYLFLTTSHDGSGSVTAAFTPIRIVCNNTLNAAMRNHSNAIKIRHTMGAQERLEQAHKVMGISYRLADELEVIFNQWTKVRISDPQVKRLIELAMTPNREVLKNLQEGREEQLSMQFRKVCERVYEYALSSPTQQTETAKGTVFGAYNAVTGYFQNVRSYKDGEAKLKSVLLGGTAQARTQKAFDLCDDFVTKGESVLHLN
jgi:phage/plasmid-like protein (TIGR03299 family)